MRRHSWMLLTRASIPTEKGDKSYMANLYKCSKCPCFKSVGRPDGKTFSVRYRYMEKEEKSKEVYFAPSCPVNPLV